MQLSGVSRASVTRAASAQQLMWRRPARGAYQLPQTPKHVSRRYAPVRAATSAETVKDSVNGTTVKGRVLTPLKEFMENVKERLDIKDMQPPTVENISPDEIKKCIQYGAWAWAAYEKDTDRARTKLEMVRAVSGTTGHLLDGSLNIVSGSSQLDLGLIFRKLMKTDTQALVGLLDDGKGGLELVLAFRGSEKKASDWITDFFIDMDPAKELVGSIDDTKCLVHAGFKDSANDFLTFDQKHPTRSVNLYGRRDATDKDRAAYSKALDNKRQGKELSDDQNKALELSSTTTLKELAHTLAGSKKITKVVCCGHSLGGALATVTAFWCKKVGWPELRVECYTYGAPRVGNTHFADLWNAALRDTSRDKLQDAKCSYRVMHRHDPVPGVPASNLPIPLPDLPTISIPYMHVEGGVLLCQPGVDPMRGLNRITGLFGNPAKWPTPSVDKVNGYQAQRRRRPIDLDNTVPGDHDIDMYVCALIDTLKNSKH